MRKSVNNHRQVRLVSTLAFVGFLSTILSADVGALDQRQLEQALAKVTVLENGSPVARASGFAWKQKDWVVTSLHAMRKGATYQIERPGQSDVWVAVPIKHLMDHDLVLLELRSTRDTQQKLAANKQPHWTPYKDFDAAPTWNTEVFVVGYYLDTPEPRHITMKISKSSSPLQSLIPTKHAEKIRLGGIPNIAEEVVHFQGPLLPGYSGSPVVNQAGRLVAIGDGGLEQGAIDISWGIKADHLKRLETATGGPLPDALVAVSQLYSAGLDVAQKSQSIKFGPYEFVYKKTRTFAEMLESSDNPEDLRYQMSDTENVNTSSFRYDIYQDINFGLVIAVPAGHELRATQDGLEVQFGRYSINYDAGASGDEIQQLLAQPDIHQALANGFVESAELVPGTYEFDEDSSSCDRSLEGGVLATLAFNIADHNGNANFVFSKIAIKGQLYLLSAVALDDLGEAMPRIEQNQCMTRSVDCGRIDPSAPCATVCNWLHAVTSVYLTSFSNFKATGQGCSLYDQPALFDVSDADAARTAYGVIDWASFEPNALRLAEDGLYVSDLEVLVENGQWVLGGLHQPLPLPTYWRYGLIAEAFYPEVQALAQQGYQLKDLEITWDGALKFAGVFQSDYRQTVFNSYTDWQQMLAGFQQAEQAGWGLIDLEVTWAGDHFFIAAVYQYNAGRTAYRFANSWENLQGFTNELAGGGFYMTDIETYWDGQTQWYAGVYSQASSPSFAWIGEWPAFEQQTTYFESQGQYLEDIEVFFYNGTRWAIGVYR